MAYGNQQQVARPSAVKEKMEEAKWQSVIDFLKGLDGVVPWTLAELQQIWEGCPDRMTMRDLKDLLYFCKANGLNPLMGDIFAEYKWGGDAKGAYVFCKTVTIDAYRRRAAQEGTVDASWPEYGKDDGGQWVETHILPIGRSRATVARRYVHEYKAMGGKVAEKMLLGMTEKASEALCYRKLGILTGSHSEDEDWNEIGSTMDPPPATETVEGYAIGKKPTEATPAAVSPAPPVAQAAATTAAPASATPPAAPKAATAAATTAPKATETPTPAATAPATPAPAAPAPVATPAAQAAAPAATQPDVQTQTSTLTPEEAQKAADNVTRDRLQAFCKKTGIKKEPMTAFWRGYLNIETGALPKDLAVYAPALPSLEAMADDAAFMKELTDDPRAFGKKIAGAPKPPTAEEVREFFDVSTDPSTIDAAIDLMQSGPFSIKELAEFLTNFDILGLQEPDIRNFMRLAAHSTCAVTVSIASKKSGHSITIYAKAIEDRLGKILEQSDGPMIDAAAAIVIDKTPAVEPKGLFA